MTVSGNRNCSGALINNTQQDNSPYLLTAYHCGIRSGNAPSLVVFYNYENSTSSTRLRGWLAPTNTGATEIDGRDANAVVLHVELISFSGTAKECSYALSWSVAGEENFSHYEVEKSTDGRTFTTFSRVEGGRRDYTLRMTPQKGRLTTALRWCRGGRPRFALSW
jgi:hypothetical protein